LFLQTAARATVGNDPAAVGDAGRIRDVRTRYGFWERRTKMSSKQSIYGCVLALTIATAAHATSFFVDAGQGNDLNAGLSAAAPFRTIQRAIDEAAAWPGPDRIQIGAGAYSENLTISDADGLTLSGASGVVVVAANSSKDVVKISWGDVSMSSLAVTGGSKGITPTGSAEKPVSLSLRDVIVTGNAGDGVKPTSVGEVRASRCTFLANGGTGLKVRFADNVTVSDCAFEDNGGRGLRAEDVKSVTISHCQFLNNNDDGMKMVTVTLDRAESNLSISDTTLSGSADDGIDLELLGDIRLTNVTVRDTVGDDGMSVDDSVSVSVVSSTFTNSSADGLDMDDTQSIRLVNVVSTGNGVSGFQVTAEEHFNIESLSIVGSEFSDNSLDGIWVKEEGTIVEQVSLTSVTATGNAGRGLNMGVSGTARLSAVTSEDNGADDVLPGQQESASELPGQPPLRAPRGHKQTAVPLFGVGRSCQAPMGPPRTGSIYGKSVALQRYCGYNAGTLSR
jgi:hypothetical protein